MRGPSRLDEDTEAGLSAYFNAVAFSVGDEEDALSVVADADLRAFNLDALVLEELVGGVDVLNLKCAVVGRLGDAVGVFDQVDHCAAGELEPDDVLAVHRAWDPLDAEDIDPELGCALLVNDVVCEVIDFRQPYRWVCEYHENPPSCFETNRNRLCVFAEHLNTTGE